MKKQNMSKAGMRAAWLKIAALAIAIFATACGDPPPEELRYEWEDFPDEAHEHEVTGSVGEDKITLVKGHGINGADGWSPCYRLEGSHDCVALPKVKSFYWATEPGDAPASQQQQLIWDAIRFSWQHYSKDQKPGGAWGETRDGFVMLQVGWDDPRRNVDVSLDTVENGGSWGSGGCTILTSSYNAPAPIIQARFYRGCYIHINLGDLVARQYTCFNETGNWPDGWNVGWFMGTHEGGHLKGFSHQTPSNQPMYKHGLCHILYDAGYVSYSEQQMDALSRYRPDGAGFQLEQIPYWDPYPEGG